MTLPFVILIGRNKGEKPEAVDGELTYRYGMLQKIG